MMAVSHQQQIADMTNDLIGNGEQDTSPTRHFVYNCLCSMCSRKASYPVKKNCGHLFCARCLMSKRQCRSWLGATNCLVCLRKVTVLLRCFPESTNEDDFPETTNEDDLEEMNEMLFAINDYNRLFATEFESWVEVVQNLRALFQHAVSDFFPGGNFSHLVRLSFVIALTIIIAEQERNPGLLLLLGFLV